MTSEISAGPDKGGRDIAFIGGGNMARSLVGGLLKRGWGASCIHVADPSVQTREALAADFNIGVHAVNLLSSAVKYTPRDGGVSSSVASAGDHGVLTVADEGIGIAEDDLARLGTEFFRSSNPVAVAQPGTGLGLAIVRRVVARSCCRSVPA